MSIDQEHPAETSHATLGPWSALMLPTGIHQRLLRLQERTPQGMLWVGAPETPLEKFAWHWVGLFHCQKGKVVEESLGFDFAAPSPPSPAFNAAEASAQRPCGECAGCRQLIQSTLGDVRWLRPGETGTIAVDDARDFQSWVHLKSLSGGHRIGIIVAADTMNVSAQNALLKTLEEPPPGVTLLLLSAHPGKLLSTIRSRVQILRFPLPESALAKTEAPAFCREILGWFQMNRPERATRMETCVSDASWRSSVIENLDPLARVFQDLWRHRQGLSVDEMNFPELNAEYFVTHAQCPAADWLAWSEALEHLPRQRQRHVQDQLLLERWFYSFFLEVR